MRFRFGFQKMVLAFCSLGYELILAQTLAAFLSHTVLRYSVTIGLYLCSMGVGAMLAGRIRAETSFRALLSVEAALSLIGGGSVILVFLTDAAAGTGWVFAVGVHALIIAIGVLTGFELPLMMAGVRQSDARHGASLLPFDYAGAFLGTLAFVFMFYPRWGLLVSSLWLGLVNALAGLTFFGSAAGETGKPAGLVLRMGVLVMLALAWLAALGWSEQLNTALMGLYMR